MKLSIFGQPYRFQEDNNGQSIQKGGAIGNMLRKMWGTHRILDGNTMRTWWEHIENNKGLTPLPLTLPKRVQFDALCNFIG